MKFHKKYFQLVFSLVLGFMMSGIMSFLVGGLNQGFNHTLLVRWPKDWLQGFVLVVPLMLILSPRVRSWLERYTI